MAATAQPALAIGTTVNPGTAGSYSVLGGQSVTNTGPSVLSGNVGVSPGTGVSGFPPGITGGVIHAAYAHASQAQADLLTAYNKCGRASLRRHHRCRTRRTDTGSRGQYGTQLPPDHRAAHPGREWQSGGSVILQIGSGLTTASSSSVVLLNDAQSCHVFWQVAESATLGTGPTFVGTIMALTSIEVKTGATIEGRALARNGSVTLDDNLFTDTRCATTSTTPPSPSATSTTTRTPTATATPTPSPTTRVTSSPTATTTATSSPTPTRSATVAAAEDARLAARRMARWRSPAAEYPYHRS